MRTCRRRHVRDCPDFAYFSRLGRVYPGRRGLVETEDDRTDMQVVNYEELVKECRGLLTDERDMLVNAANFAAFVFQNLPAINWAGFYLHDGVELVLGPFQGKPACTRIQNGKGVCGTAYARAESIVVEDVHSFAGHIACDPDSRSEVVIPLRNGDQVYGVFDVDSPLPARFSDADRAGLEKLVAVFESSTQFRSLFSRDTV